MLDDLQYIHEKDSQDALGVVAQQAMQLQHDFGSQLQLNVDISNVVIAGMGGSALAAALLRSWPGLNVPFEIVRDYTIPSYVGSNTLFIASSYSGNTEETVSALNQAIAKQATVVVIASGGLLAKAAEEKGYPLLRLPGGLQPRMAVLYSLTALVQLLEPTGMIGSDRLQELRAAGTWLGQQTITWQPDTITKGNQAKQIAQELIGKSVVIYSGTLFFPVAYKWKINFNENAKHIAWCNQFPEFNHNEFMGWTGQPVQKPYGVIELRSNLEHERLQKRFLVTERLLSGKRPTPIIITPQGDTLIQQLLWTVVLGDFVSVYLAILNGINPTPVGLIEKFKTALNG